MRHAKLLALAAALLAAACSETPTAHQSAPPAASFDKGGNTLGSGNVVSGGGTTETQDGIFAGSGNYTDGTSSDSTATDGSVGRGVNGFGSGG